MRIRLEGVPHRYHEDHIPANGINSLNHYNLGLKFIPMPHALKILDTKAALEKIGKNEKLPAWHLAKVRNKKEVIDEARKRGRKVHFASLMDLCHLKKRRGRTKAPKIHRTSRVPRRHGKRWFRITRRICWIRIISVPNDSRKKSWTLFPDFLYVQVKQLMKYPLLRRSKWKMHQRYWKFQSQNAQTFGYVYQSTNGRNHGPVWKTQLFLLNGICTVTVWQDYCGNGNLRKFYWEKVPNWECLFVNRGKGLFLSVYVDDLKLAGKKLNIDPTWKTIMKDVDLGEPKSILMFVQVALKRMSDQQGYCG